MFRLFFELKTNIFKGDFKSHFHMIIQLILPFQYYYNTETKNRFLDLKNY